METGRYTKPKTPECERVCLICNAGKIENEYHFVFECPLYSYERELLYDKLSELSTIECVPNEVNFITLMNNYSDDVEFAKIICKYVDVCFQLIMEVMKKNTAEIYCISKYFSTIVEFLRLARTYNED